MRSLPLVVARASLVWLIPVSVCDGMEPPRTAMSHSVQAPVEVLDDPGNAFRFPQLAVGSRSSLAAYGATGSGADAAVLVELKDQRLFHRFRDFSSRTLSRSLWWPFGFDSHPRYQVGWAGRLRGTRLGLACSWSTVGERDRREFRSPQTFEEIVQSEFETVDVRHGSVGVGWGEEVSVDLVLDVLWDRMKHDFTRRHEATDFLNFDSQSVVANLDHRLGAAARVELPLGAEGGVTVHGSYQDATLAFEGESLSYEVRRGRTTYRDERRQHRHEHGVDWSVACRVESARDRLPDWGLHGRFSLQRGPWRSVAFPYSLDRVWSRAETSEVGVSHARRGPFGIELRSGFAVSHELVATVREHLGSTRFTERDRDERKSTSSTFAWGVRRTIGPIDIASSLSTRLDPLDLVSILDATIHF